MSVSITIGSNRVQLDNETLYNRLPNIINILEDQVRRGCEMIITIIDFKTANFHKYVFDYTIESKLSPKVWLLNNIVYSLLCDDTKKNMDGMFDRICDWLKNELIIHHK